MNQYDMATHAWETRPLDTLGDSIVKQPLEPPNPHQPSAFQPERETHNGFFMEPPPIPMNRLSNVAFAGFHPGLIIVFTEQQHEARV